MLYTVEYSRIGDRMFLGCKVLILPKFNQMCSNLITYAQICLNFAQI